MVKNIGYQALPYTNHILYHKVENCFVIEIFMICLYFQNDVISCAHQVESLEKQLATRMEQLQATVQSKTAVPTAQVYVRTHL